MNFDARPCALGLGAAALFMVLYDLHYGLIAEAQLQHNIENRPEYVLAKSSLTVYPLPTGTGNVYSVSGNDYTSTAPCMQLGLQSNKP